MEAKDVLKSITDCIFPSDFHVLVIDDDPTCSSYVTKMLQACKFEVTPCHPSAALGILREKKDTFNLLMVKVHMSDGIDAFSLLEQTRRACHLPALMLTLVPTERVSKQCSEYTDCYHLTFPISVAKLISCSYSAYSKWKVNNNISRASGSSTLQQANQAPNEPTVPPLEHFVVRGTETEDDIRRYRSAQTDLPAEVKKSFSDILDELESHLAVAKTVIGLMHKGESSSGRKKDQEPPAGKK